MLPASEFGYYIAITKAGLRTLHEAPRCWRVPGLDYTPEDFAPRVSRPEPEEYHLACKDCWRIFPIDRHAHINP